MLTLEVGHTAESNAQLCGDNLSVCGVDIHMSNPKLQTEIPDKPKRRGRQPSLSENPVGSRLREALNGREYGWLSGKTGIPASTISDYVQKGISRADNALKISDALDVSVDWLLRGGARQSLSPRPVDATEADWVELPEVDLRSMSETEKGEVISRTVFRRDWLNRSFGRDKGLWTTRLPSDYPPLDLNEGDDVICCDTSREELVERQLCVWRSPVLGKLLVARFSFVHRGNRMVVIEDGEYWANPYLVEGDLREGLGADLIPVGRILGRPLAPIR